MCALRLCRPLSCRVRITAAAPVAPRGHATLACALHATAARQPQALAALAPHQDVKLTYEQLQARVCSLVGALKERGYQSGDVIATDLPTCVENLVLQLAASHFGAAVLAVKSLADLAKFRQDLPVRGAAMLGPASFLATAQFELQGLAAQPMEGLRQICPADLSPAMQTPTAGDTNAPLGYYSSSKPTSNSAVMAAGAAAQEKLGMCPSDIVLVSITLNHLFGIGSAASAALQSGSAVLLPSPSGIVGCGNPAQRAEAVLHCMKSFGCTLLFADTHTLAELPAVEPGQLQALRGGVVKIGSGSDFLPETREYAGVALATMGKAKP